MSVGISSRGPTRRKLEFGFAPPPKYQARRGQKREQRPIEVTQLRIYSLQVILPAVQAKAVEVRCDVAQNGQPDRNAEANLNRSAQRTVAPPL